MNEKRQAFDSRGSLKISEQGTEAIHLITICNNGPQQREAVGGRNNEEIPVAVQSRNCSEGFAGAYVCVYDSGERNRRKSKLELELTASHHR